MIGHVCRVLHCKHEVRSHNPALHSRTHVPTLQCTNKLSLYKHCVTKFTVPILRTVMYYKCTQMSVIIVQITVFQCKLILVTLIENRAALNVMI